MTTTKRIVGVIALAATTTLASLLGTGSGQAVSGGSSTSEMGGSVARLTSMDVVSINNPTGELCTGSVAGDGWVLTAHHCLGSRDWRQLRVQLWKDGTVGSGTSWSSALAQAPIFRSGTRNAFTNSRSDPGWSDVMLLQTASAMPSWAKTIPVGVSWPSVGTALTFFGYGRAGAGSTSPSAMLQKTPQGDQKRVDCTSLDSKVTWTSGHLCAKGTTSQVWPGDSGGPLLWWVNGYWQQVGVTSFAPDGQAGLAVHGAAWWATVDGSTRSWVRSYVTGSLSQGTVLKNAASSNHWMFGWDGYRHWVPDERTRLCLLGSRHPFASWPIRRIETIPDKVGSGGWASCQRDSLSVDHTLRRGDYLRSSDGRYSLHLQSSDGNLVLYSASGRAVWATNRAGGDMLVLQGDGNLVVYDASGHPLWATSTVGRGANRFVVQSDGNMVLYTSSGVAVWASNTVGR